MIFSTGSALGCPVCDTETGRQVREGIFGNDFGLNLLAVMAPVPILVLSAYVVSHWLGKEDKP